MSSIKPFESNPRRYCSDLKRKLNTEGFSQLYEIIVQLGCIEILNELQLYTNPK